MEPALEAKLRHLLTVFLEENAKLNLSALRDEEKCWIGNILDSLSLYEYIAEGKGKIRVQNVNNMMDLGTGGGFPFLPLAIALPKVECMGMDATGKKLKAVEVIIERLGIKNAKTLLGRAEDLAQDNWYRDRFDVVTSRAVAETRVILEYMAPFAKTGGWVVLWKSVNIEAEFAASHTAEETLGLKFADRHTYELPGDFGQRQLLIYEKISQTPREYPRKNGEPKKHPL
jgi:16S rRNA (guanine527-N7)-methyltransferase